MNFSDSRGEVCQNFHFFFNTRITVSRRNEEKSFVFFPLAFLALGSTRFLKEKKSSFLACKKTSSYFGRAISALPYMYVHNILLAIYIQPPYTRERYFTWQILQISKVPLREGEALFFNIYYCIVGGTTTTSL